MGQRLPSLIAWILLLLLAGPSWGNECFAPPPLKPIHRVCGIVINLLGEPLSDAKVTVLQDGREIASRQTSKDGKFSFEQLPAGNYDIKVVAHDYLSANFSIVIARSAVKCKRALQVLLAVGSCGGGIGEIKPSKMK
jgi:hypothetical protein